MASKTASFFAASSTWLVKSGTGTVYGVTVANPVSGGTVVVADLLNAGAVPNLGIPSTFGPNVLTYAGPFAANLSPFDISTQGRQFTNGLTVSVTSTVGVVVHYD